MPAASRLLATALLLLLALVPAGCFGEDRPPQAGRAGGAGKTDGGATPEEVVANLEAASAGQDLGAVVRQIAPEDRALLTAMVSFTVRMMPQMMKGVTAVASDVATRMSEALAGEDLTASERRAVEEARAQVAPFDELERGIEALFAKYGIDESALDRLSALGSMKNRSEAADRLNAAIGGIDHAGFVGEAMALLDRAKTAPRAGASGASFDRFVVEPATLRVAGDRATVRLGGRQAVLLRRDSRWYLSLRESDV
jgi:hypothetical protein